MEQFYLEVPSLKRKNDIIDYINEFVKYGSSLNGIGALSKVLDDYSFEQALECCLKCENEDYAKEMGRCQSKTFLLVRRNDNKVVGAINVRWNLPKEMLQFGGHIGYGIRPTERRRGYNKINLYLGLIEAQKLGLDKVMINCEVDNIGSDKTLKALGGCLEKTEIDPADGLLTNVYWFEVEETINKYRDIYNEKIYQKKAIN